MAPSGTAVPLATGSRPSGSENIAPSVAVTIAGSCGLHDGERHDKDSIGPLAVSGRSAGWAACDSTNGPCAITLFTMAATVPCSGSARVHDVVVAEVPDRGLHRRGAVVLVRQRRLVGHRRVVLVQQARDVADVGHAGGVPRAEVVADATEGVHPDVDAEQLDVRADTRVAEDDAGEALVQWSERSRRVGRRVGNGGVGHTAHRPDEPEDAVPGAGPRHDELRRPVAGVLDPVGIPGCVRDAHGQRREHGHDGDPCPESAHRRTLPNSRLQ